MESLILLGVAIPIGLLVGWVLGIQGWSQARQARAELRQLRVALREAGIAVPEPGDGAAYAYRPAAAPPEKAASPEPAAAPEPAIVSPWARPAATSESAPEAPPAPPPPPAATARPGLEEALTLRWGTWLGAGAILLAGVFLLRIAVEEGWLGPAARCALAAALGLALVAGAEWLRRRPLPDRPSIPWPDQAPGALAAGGVAVLFGAAYATAAMYALVPPLLGFALMATAALVGLGLALIHGPVVAAIGILGAYAAPALVETQDPSLPGLFLYLLAVTFAALFVVRQVAAAWLGWGATVAGALWVLLGGVMATGPGDLWAPVLFVPAAAALHLFLLPGAALESAIGRRLAWAPFAILAASGLALLLGGTASLAPAAAILLLTPVAVAKGAAEPRLDRLPWLAALAGLLLLLIWPIGAWTTPGEPVTIEGVVQAVLPGEDWPPAALRPFLAAVLILAALHAAAGAWFERRAAHPLRWAALMAAVPLLALLVAYARVRGFALDIRWAVAALALAAALIGATALAMKEAARERAGAHAAGAVGALALGVAMLLSDQWLTLAVALFLPALAWIEARADLPALRRVAIAVAGFVLVRLLLNWHVLEYGFGATPVLNGLLLAFGLPAALFALAAFIFRRRGDDLTVALLEAGAILFATALLLTQIRHFVTGGAMADTSTGWSFTEAALQVTGLAALATVLRLLDRRLGGRPVSAHGWRLLHGAALAVGTLLILFNPALEPGDPITVAVFNTLALAYAIPAALAAFAAQAPDSRWPRGWREVLGAYAVLALFTWLTLEVRRYFNPESMALVFADPAGAELYAYSAAWLGFAAAVLALGIRQGSRELRLAALGLMGLTVAKAFLIDMDELSGLWRVLSFLGLGLALIALGWVYRRFVVATPPPPGAAAGT